MVGVGVEVMSEVIIRHTIIITTAITVTLFALFAKVRYLYYRFWHYYRPLLLLCEPSLSSLLYLVSLSSPSLRTITLFVAVFGITLFSFIANHHSLLREPLLGGGCEDEAATGRRHTRPEKR